MEEGLRFEHSGNQEEFSLIVTFFKFNSNIFIDFSGSRAAVYLKGNKKGTWPNKSVPTSHLLPSISSQYLAEQNSHVLSPCSTFPLNSSVWQLVLHNMVKLLPQRAIKAWIQLPGKATDSSQQGHLAQLTVVVFIWDWADKGISFQVEKHKLYLYADNFLFVGFSITGWISGLSFQCSPTTWNTLTVVWVGDVLPEAGEMPQYSWLWKAEVEGHDQASLLCFF